MYNFSCALNESYAAQVTVVGGGPAGTAVGEVESVGFGELAEALAELQQRPES